MSGALVRGDTQSCTVCAACVTRSKLPSDCTDARLPLAIWHFAVLGNGQCMSMWTIQTQMEWSGPGPAQTSCLLMLMLTKQYLCLSRVLPSTDQKPSGHCSGSFVPEHPRYTGRRSAHGMSTCQSSMVGKTLFFPRFRHRDCREEDARWFSSGFWGAVPVSQGPTVPSAVPARCAGLKGGFTRKVFYRYFNSEPQFVRSTWFPEIEFSQACSRVLTVSPTLLSLAIDR